MADGVRHQRLVMDGVRDQRLLVAGCVVALLVGLLAANWIYQGLMYKPTADDLIGDVPSPDLLTEHTNEFKKGVYKVTEGIHTAIGYAIANSILIEAPEGLIIVDTTESLAAAKEIFAAFREISKAPVKAIIYTHNHADHLSGTSAFIEEGAEPPQVWAHEMLMELLGQFNSVLPVAYTRATRQFGLLLQRASPRAFRNAGIGPFLRYGGRQGVMEPTHLVRGAGEDLTIAGLPLRIDHIPGETDDQIGVWIPSHKAFLCADDLYRAFPNLYAIRGTPARDTLLWARSLDLMIAHEPEFLVPSHGRALRGREYIRRVLSDYRDAIRVVHDQTVRYMNKGMLPDDIVHQVRLPDSLAKSPFLHTFYGTIEWSVRTVFDRYMGWFSGDVSELSRHSTLERARRVVALGGGASATARAARQALDEGDLKWSLELASAVLKVDPSSSVAQQVRLESLKGLGSQQMSANGRNYYLSVALEDAGLVDLRVPPEVRRSAVRTMNPDRLFGAMALRLKAEMVEGVAATLVFNFIDINETYSLRIRNCVLDVLRGAPPADATVTATVTYDHWREVVAGDRSALALYFSGSLQVEGGLSEFKTFISYIDTD